MAGNQSILLLLANHCELPLSLIEASNSKIAAQQKPEAAPKTAPKATQSGRGASAGAT